MILFLLTLLSAVFAAELAAPTTTIAPVTSRYNNYQYNPNYYSNPNYYNNPNYFKNPNYYNNYNNPNYYKNHQYYKNSQYYQNPSYLHDPEYYRRYYADNRARAEIDRNAAIITYNSDVNDKGFHYDFETQNGIRADETGVEQDGIQAQGSFSYTGDDGQQYALKYSAGAAGYLPEADFLPTSPPVPAAIQRALDANAKDEANGIFDDGSYRGEGAESGAVAALRTRQYYDKYRAGRYQPYQPYRDGRYYNQFYKN